MVGLDPLTGAARFAVELPAPDDEVPFAVATPALVDDLLVVSYHTTAATDSRDVTTPRLRQRVAVVRLEGTPGIDARFAPLDLTATLPAAGGGSVSFQPEQQLARGELVHGRAPGDTLGRVYVTFGNARDLQPWHGWVFEVSLDAWLAGGPQAALTAVLVTTPESECGATGHSGSRERVCGGGLWSPTGPLLVERGESGFEPVLAPGNGQLDLARGDYANTLMRTGPGLAFDPACDAEACADFDADEPADACTESCANLFVPRPFGTFIEPENGVCDGLPFFECWEKLDFVGGSTPVHLTLDSGTEVLAYPTKDGAVYLVDYAHFGTLYDREQLVAICGTAEAACWWDWAGMIVTQPAVAQVNDAPVVIVPTFMPDPVHPAGVIGLDVTEASRTPELAVRWRFPDFASPEALTRFRRHPTQPLVVEHATPNGARVPVAWLVDTAAPGEAGRLVALRADDGDPLVDAELAGPGYRFPRPLVHDGVIYVPSCESDSGRGSIEGYRIVAGP